MDSDPLQTSRLFLRNEIRRHLDFSATEQARGVPPPPIEKPCPPDRERIELPGPDAWGEIGDPPLLQALARRASHRVYAPAPFTLAELSFLLWATQGVRAPCDGVHAFRTVPSAGCRHAFETYVAALRVEGLAPGLYRFLPLSHRLAALPGPARLAETAAEACLGQRFVAQAGAVFFWAALPARMEWRYGLAAHKLIALDAGHVCQNLYLACEALGAGACAIAAYDQEAVDRLLGVDGREEFVVYLAPAGKLPARP